MAARKTRSTPTRTVAYGLPFGPDAECEQLVSDQFFAARRYRNELIAIERTRAQSFRDLRSAASPELAEREADVERIAAELSGVREAIKAAKKEIRGRAATPELQAQARDLRAQLAEAKRARKDATAAANAAVQGEPAQEVNRAAYDAIKAAYGESPAFWGTKLLIARAVEQAIQKKRKEKSGDVEHKAWDRVVSRRTGESLGGSGVIGVQIQAKSTTEDLLAGRCGFARLSLGRRISGGRRHAVLSLRVGSDGRTPVWATFPLLYHRDLPAGARITWVWVTRKRESVHRFRWQACFSVESDTYETPARLPSSVAAVNFGWRQLDNGDLRTGYLVGTDGHEESIQLPKRIRDTMAHARSLREIRQRHLNDLIARLPELIELLPEERQNALRELRQSKSFSRYNQAAYALRDQVGEDNEAVAALVEWAKRDVHLGDWEAREVDKAGRRRREHYRLIARRLCERYSEIVVDDTDLSALARRKPAEDADQDLEQAQRRQRTEAAPSELRQALVLAASNTGTRLTKGNVSDAPSARCHVCGGEHRWDGVDHRHRCERCGAAWDADANFCRNLLAFSAREVAE